MNKVALITGASRGLGKVIAGFLAAQNFELILTARGAEALTAAAAELQSYGGQIVALPGDVSDGAHQQAQRSPDKAFLRESLLQHQQTVGAKGDRR